MPIYAFLGARLVLQLLEEGLQGKFCALAREEVVHAKDELRRAHIVEVEILIFITCDVALLVNHLGRIFLQIVDDSLIVGFSVATLEGALAILVGEVSVEHTFHLDAHHITPTGFVWREIEVVWMSHTLHFTVGEPLAIGLIRLVCLVEHQRTIDGEVVKLHVASLARNLDRLLLNAIKLAVLHGDVAHILHLVTADDEGAVVALLASHVLHINLAHTRFETTVAYLLRLVVEVDFQDSLLALSHGDVAHVDVLDDTATAVVGLDAEDAFEVRRVHHAVFSKDILATTGDFTSDDHAAMTVLHLAMADDDVAGRLVPEATIIVATALDGDAVVTGMEHTVLDEYVLTSLRVATIAVRTFVPDGNAIHGDVLGEERVDDPER